MRHLSRAAAALAAFAPLLAWPAAGGPESEAAKPAASQEQAESTRSEAAEQPLPPAPPVEEVPDFEAPDPPDFSIIDPNHPPPPGELPTPAEMEEKAKREAVGRQTEKLEKQSSHGVGQSYFGGGIY